MSAFQLIFLPLLVVLIANHAQAQVDCNDNLPSTCLVNHIYFPRYLRRYHVSSRQPATVTTLRISDAKLGVFSRDFCDTLSNTEIIRADNVGIEIIDQDAFEMCTELRFVYLFKNLIEILPEGLFRANSHLLSVELNSNFIRAIPEYLFENQGELLGLAIEDNYISSLSPTVFKTNKNLGYLYFDSNDVQNLELDKILLYTPKLQKIGLKDNLLLCSKVEGILEVVRKHKLELSIPVEEKRKRFFKMDLVQGIDCIYGQ